MQVLAVLPWKTGEDSGWDEYDMHLRAEGGREGRGGLVIDMVST